MANPFNYKVAHRLLLASIGDANGYATDWHGIARSMKSLVTAKGFSPRGRSVPELIRAKVAKRRSEANVLRAGANALRRAPGASTAAGHRRVLALKTIRHLYHHASMGKQRIWILNVPKGLRKFPVELANEPAALVDAVLNSTVERFDHRARKDLSHACQLGLAWVQKAMLVAGSPLTPQHKKLFHRWFVPFGTADEDRIIQAWGAAMLPKLQKIAFGLKTGEVILTDAPQERGSGSDWETSEAFTFTNSDIITIFVELAFFSAGNTLSGVANWARVIVHELTHAYVGTDDHSYSWQGLLPRTGDVFGAANDRAVRQNLDFPAVRLLTLEQCKDNADSWAFFIADCAGALNERDRIAALGGKLYDTAGEPMSQAVRDQLRNRSR